MTPIKTLTFEDWKKMNNINKLNNIIVENLSLEFGQELKKTFEELGVDTKNLRFTLCKSNGNIDRFYGIINNSFDAYGYKQIEKSNAKIITLEELKAMKNPYPKFMFVSDNSIDENNKGDKFKVYFEKEIKGHTYYFIKDCNSFISYKYAVDLDYFDDQVKEITIKEIAQRFGYPIEQIRIKK